MRKLLLIPILALTLAACGNNEDGLTEEEVEERVEEVEDLKETEEETEEGTNNESEGQETSTNTSSFDYEESELLEEHIPLDELTFQVEIDNQNKGIILFENDENEKVYKSIFIKNDKDLKIIDISNDSNNGLIYKGSL